MLAICRFPLSRLTLALCVALPLGAIHAQSQTDLTEQTVLEPVFITATGTDHSLRDAPASVSVVSKEELDKRPVNDVLDAVRDMEGMSLVGRGVGGRKTLSIRGMDSWHSLMLIDGKRQSSSDDVFGHSDFQLGWVPMQAIERIEVVRGPLSSLYGSEALGGVVNVITRVPTDAWIGSFSVSGGNTSDAGGAENRLAAWLGGPLVQDVLGLSINATTSRTAASPSVKNSAVSAQEGRSKESIGATLRYTPTENQAFDVGFQIDRSARWRRTTSGTTNYRSNYNLDRDHYFISYRGDFSGWEITGKAYRSQISQSNQNSDNIANTATQKITDTVGELQATSPLWYDQRITVGTEFRKEKLVHPNLNNGSDSMKHSALYVQDEWNISDQLIATFGLRWDHHEKFGSEVSPRIYLVWKPDDYWTIKGGYGEGFRAPTIKQISPEYSFAGNHSFVGNPNLKPETSESWEISAAYDEDAFGVRATYFHTNVDDLISTSCIQNCDQTLGKVYEYINVTSARINGIESNLRVTPNEQWQFDLNYTWLDTKNKTTGKELSGRPKHSANAKVAWRPDFAPADSEAFIRVEYVGEQVTYSGSKTIDLPDYTLLHIGLSSPINENLFVKAGVENVTNKRLEKKSDDFSYDERGRYWYIGLDLNF